MTVRELIGAVDALRPNGYTMAQKTAWLEDMEGEIWREVLLRSEGDGFVSGGSERSLLLPDAWRRLYQSYLAAMIDFSNAEYTKYSNSMAAYNSAYAAFAAWYAERFAPADRPAYWAKAARAAYDGAAAGPALAPGAVILAAVCQVDEAFNGEKNALTLGTTQRPTALMDAADCEPGARGRYFKRGLFIPVVGEERLCAAYDGDATEGAAQFAVLVQPGRE